MARDEPYGAKTFTFKPWPSIFSTTPWRNYRRFLDDWAFRLRSTN